MNWLTKVVSTTLVVVTGCVIAVAMTLFYMLATVLGKELDPITFGSMLAFAGSCMGIAYKQFKAKRETEWAEDEDGVAYRPLTASAMAEKRSRYDVGVRMHPKRPTYTPPALPPESVDERENAGHVVSPVPGSAAEDAEYGD